MIRNGLESKIGLCGWKAHPLKDAEDCKHCYGYNKICKGYIDSRIFGEEIEKQEHENLYSNSSSTRKKC